MNVELLWHRDWFLAPIYIALFVLLTKYWMEKYYNGLSYKKYIIPAYLIKLIGCLASILIHQFYYKGGDAFMYFETGLKINDIFWKEPLETVGIIFSPANYFSQKQWELLQLNIYSSPFRYETNALMCKIGGILSFFTFKSYLCISLFTCYFSFLGSWRLFLMFRELYPKFEKEVAICMLFIPSVSFWGGGGLQKETILMASLGFFIHSFYWLIIKKHFNYRLVLTLLISFSFIAIVRTFTAMVLLPAILVWILLHYNNILKNGYKKITLIFFLTIIGFLGVYLVSKNTTKYNFNSITKYFFHYQETNAHISNLAQSQSYDLGVVEHSLLGIIKSAPLCITTALYRPSLLEAKKYFSVCAGIENLILLGLSVWCIIRIVQRKIKYTWIIISRPEIVFCLLYALCILFIVGFTTINFGGLVRCRISALPFFSFALMILSNNANNR